jgi:hypothetical protein
MKSTFVISIFTILANIDIINAQIVTIPDANFKTALLTDPNINTNGDAEIQVSEAAAYTGAFNITSRSIASLTGIEAFTALTLLDCGSNLLSSIDVSANTALTNIQCDYNQLTNLNVSNNAALTILECNVNNLTSLNISANKLLRTLKCGNNQLTNLNVSANTALYYFDCNFNQLTSLDVSSNLALFYLFCSNNQLTSLDVLNNSVLNVLYCHDNQLSSLDVSANTALKYFYCSNNQLTSLNMQNGHNFRFISFFAIGNTSLTCIKVDSVGFMNTNFANTIDPWASFNVSCTVSIPQYTFNNFVTAYPNPTTGILNLSDFCNVLIIDIKGKLILEKKQIKTLDISYQPKGMYFAFLKDDKGEFSKWIKVTKL